MPVYEVNFKKRKRKLSLKKNAETEHFGKRLKERFGLNYSNKMRESIIRAIQNGKGTFVIKKSNRVSIWKDVVPGHPHIFVVYDKIRHEPVTPLHEDYSSVKKE